MNESKDMEDINYVYCRLNKVFMEDKKENES